MNLFSNVMRIAMRKLLPRFSRYFTSVLSLLLITLAPLCAQNFSNHNWYFGNSNIGIRFNRSDNQASAISGTASLGPGGSAVATNPINGNLLFYSDGVNIYDATHTAMPNGTGLAGNPAGNQTVVTAKVPGSTSQYYVYTRSWPTHR